MKAVSIFSGGGGMDLGLKKAGIRILLANDIDERACETYEKNLGLKPICGDIKRIKKFPRADILVACNPCQGFSKIGLRQENDPRNLLYKEIFRCLKQVKPKFVVVENVKGLIQLYQGKFFKRILNNFRRCGYDVKWQLLNAKDFGVPQNRERVFIVATLKKLNLEYEFPKPTHGTHKKPYVTLKDAISDLPKPKKEEYCLQKKWPFFYMSRNRRRRWSEVSFAIQTRGENIPLHPSCPPMKFKKRDTYVFTKSKKPYRRLSTRECARIQTFPDSFKFSEGKQCQYKIIGNAVPPLLAKKIAKSILKTHDS